MSKKVLILSGSPRKGGNSDILCDEFMRGALEAGNTVEKIRVAEKKRVITTKCGLANGLGEREGDCRSGGIWLRSDCQYSENRKPSELPA